MRGWLGQFRTIRGRRDKNPQAARVKPTRPKVREAAQLPQIEIPLRTVCFIVVKARQFGLKEFETGSDAAFNASEGVQSSVLEDTIDDAVEEELLSFIKDLNVDEQVDLVTLVWLGRGDGEVASWRDLRAEAERLHNASTGRYLLSFPLLADYLEAGLARIGLSCGALNEGWI